MNIKFSVHHSKCGCTLSNLSSEEANDLSQALVWAQEATVKNALARGESGYRNKEAIRYGRLFSKIMEAQNAQFVYECAQALCEEKTSK